MPRSGILLTETRIPRLRCPALQKSDTPDHSLPPARSSARRRRSRRRLTRVLHWSTWRCLDDDVRRVGTLELRLVPDTAAIVVRHTADHRHRTARWQRIDGRSNDRARPRSRNEPRGGRAPAIAATVVAIPVAAANVDVVVVVDVDRPIVVVANVVSIAARSVRDVVPIAADVPAACASSRTIRASVATGAYSRWSVAGKSSTRPVRRRWAGVRPVRHGT